MRGRLPLASSPPKLFLVFLLLHSGKWVSKRGRPSKKISRTTATEFKRHAK
jgi:hypothetical protein